MWGRGLYSGSRTRRDSERVEWVDEVALASSILGIGKRGPSDQVVTGFGNPGHTAECSVCVGRPMHSIFVPVYIFTGPLRPQRHREEDEFCLSGVIALYIAARVSSTFVCRQGNI